MASRLLSASPGIGRPALNRAATSSVTRDLPMRGIAIEDGRVAEGQVAVPGPASANVLGLGVPHEARRRPQCYDLADFVSRGVTYDLAGLVEQAADVCLPPRLALVVLRHIANEQR